MLDLYKRPDRAKELLEITTLSRIYYGIARVHAGTDPTLSGGAVSVKVWEEFGLPYTKRVVDAFKLIGNLNATDTLVFKSADGVFEEARALISAIGPKNFILSSGCSIPANAPPENIKAMVRAARGG